MAIILETGTVFCVGALGYGGLELLFRGSTHWTMLPAGGLCFLGLYLLEARSRMALWRKCLAGGCWITGVELLLGLLLNLRLKLGIWDYTHHFANLLGQICPLFFLIWTALTFCALPLCRLLRRRVFRRI